MIMRLSCILLHDLIRVALYLLNRACSVVFSFLFIALLSFIIAFGVIRALTRVLNRDLHVSMGGKSQFYESSDTLIH